MPFFNQDNDIAVTVRSSQSVRGVEASQCQKVGCDHLVYFSDPAGLEALSKAVIQAQDRSVLLCS
jgi:hypothetical protein